ncbi:MAG: hypothetical protein Q8O89_02130 [Nanoarchaeota archaeon]|nr:hypothetical protein [Nanoarchaeota archaeon]
METENPKKSFSEKIKDKIKSLEKEDYLLLLLIIIVLLIQLSIVTKLKQLPGPIYGGDIYHHKGMAQHIYNGGLPWKDPYYLEGYAFYGWLLHLLTASFAFILGIGILKASIYFPLVELLLGIILTYLLGIKVFKDKLFAFLFSAAWASFFITLDLNVSGFATVVMMPALALFITYAKTTKQRIFAGVIYGLCGITHASLFIGLNFYIFALIFYRIITENIENKEGKTVIKKEFKKSIINQIRWVSLILLIGIPIAMLYWGPIIFVYHGKTLNPLQEYSGSGVANFSLYQSTIPAFFNFSKGINIIFSILVILGIYYLIKNPGKAKIPLLFFIAGFIGIIHPLITKPLFNTSFGYYWFGRMFVVTQIILIIFGVFLVYLLIKKYFKPNFDLKKAVVLLALIVFIIFTSQNIKNYKNGQFTQAGFTLSTEMEAMFRMGDWIMANTDKNDVFVSTHPETSFALQSISGRKVMFSRRTHSSHFIDVNKRAADEAVMLYGNDSEKTKELLKEYNVKYLYEDFYSLQTKQQCESIWNSLEETNEGNVNMQFQSYVCLQTTAEFEEYLKQYGVEYKKITGPLDPAGGLETPKFALLAIRGTEFNSYVLNKTKLVHQELTPGGTIAVLYKIGD